MPVQGIHDTAEGDNALPHFEHSWQPRWHRGRFSRCPGYGL